MDKDEIYRQHLLMVLEANKRLNLTAITDYDEGVVLHIEDSLAAVEDIYDAPEGSLVDIGSGAGYPGIVVAVETGRETTLIESVTKKAEALQVFTEALDLQDHVAVYPGRAEEYTAQFPGLSSVVISRAVTSLPSLLELATPLLALGGRLIAYKSDSVQEEIDKAAPLKEKLGMQLLYQRSYALGDRKLPRTIVVYEKVGDPQVSLPRRPGMAQKRPYK